MRLPACARRGAGARRPSCARTTRRAAAVTVVVLAVAAPAAVAPARASAQACAASSAEPGSTTTFVLRRALRCLVNSERVGRGLAPLRRSHRLGRAARRHAGDMVAHRYFAHERPGWTLATRMAMVGWTGTAAEAIAWGCGGLGTPRAVLDSWLGSPAHRAIVLGPYRRVGIGLAVGTPTAIACSAPGTWVLDAGRRD
jgi:uncharacterized protein YkwD